MYFADAPAAAMLGTVAGDPNTGVGTWTMRMWSDAITENPAVGATEVWEFYNATVDAHPMHIHEVLFQVVNRQPIFVDEVNKTFQVVPGSVPTPPEPWENGYKDTVIALPGPGNPRAGAVHHAGPVCLALPHRRARGQRDDATVPHRAGAAGPASVDSHGQP